MTVFVRYASVALVLLSGQSLGAQPIPFAAPAVTTDAFGLTPYGLTVGDFDGDGRPEVAAALGESGFARFSFDGSGALVAGAAATSEPESYAAAAADFDGDGLDDLAVSNSDPFHTAGTTVSVFLADRASGFDLAAEPVVGQGPARLLAADLDGDGDADLAVAVAYGDGAGDDGHVAVLLNDGAGAFSPAARYEAGEQPVTLVAGDLDGDGDLDLVAATFFDQTAVLLNAGAGAFAPATVSGPPSTFQLEHPISLADADGDGDLDLLYGDARFEPTRAGLVRLFRNTGAGAFAAPETAVEVPDGYPPADLLAADLDGDGRLDLAATQDDIGGSRGGVLVARGLAGGGFGPPAVTPAGAQPHGLAALDTDGDGDLDLAVADRGSRALVVVPNVGGLFGPAASAPAGARQRLVSLGDVDGDGDPDALATSSNQDSDEGVGPAVVLLNSGGGFAAGQPVAGGAALAHGTLAELDGDGVLDLVGVSPYTEAAQRVVWARGLGDGTFQVAGGFPTDACGLAGTMTVDLDGDGDRDLVAADYRVCPDRAGTGRRLYVVRNLGLGQFAAPAGYAVPDYPFALTAADVDGDGDADVVAAHFGVTFGQQVSVLRNAGDGTLGPAESAVVGRGPYDVVAGDLDGDGDADLAVALTGPNQGGEESLVVLRNTGAGAFAEPETYDVPYSGAFAGATGLDAGDVDADGDLDLVFGNQGSGDATIFFNGGPGQFTGTRRAAVGPGLQDVHFADVTGDGRPDLVGIVGEPNASGGSALAVVRGTDGSVASEPAGLPVAEPLALSAPAPNPARASAAVALTLARERAVRVEAFDALGRRVAVLHDGMLAAGVHTLHLPVRALAPGLYVVRATTADAVVARRLVVAR